MFNANKQMMNYEMLLADNRRADDYVNATKLCKAFGKRLDNYLANKRTKELMKDDRFNSLSFQGVSGGTYFSPYLTIDLARWLSVDFHKHVISVFKAYLEGNTDLAVDIFAREKNTERLKRNATRVKSIAQRKLLTTTFQEHGGTDFIGLTENTYLGTFGKRTSQLKADRALTKKDNLRDNMSRVDLAKVILAEALAEQEIEDLNLQGNKPCLAAALNAGRRVSVI